MLPLLKGDWEKAKGIADEAVPVSIWQDTKELHIKVQNLDLKKRKTKCSSSTCHTYKQSQASGLETESRKGMIILLTVLRLCGSRVALEDRRIYCTLNQTYMNVQFVYECIHRSASIFLTVSFLFGCEKKPFMETRLCQKHIKVSNSYWTGEGGKKKEKKKGKKERKRVEFWHDG